MSPDAETGRRPAARWWCWTRERCLLEHGDEPVASQGVEGRQGAAAVADVSIAARFSVIGCTRVQLYKILAMPRAGMRAELGGYGQAAEAEDPRGRRRRDEGLRARGLPAAASDALHKVPDRAASRAELTTYAKAKGYKPGWVFWREREQQEVRGQGGMSDEIAEDIARTAHQGQFDKAGQSYIGHVERVVASLLRRWPTPPTTRWRRRGYTT